MGSELPSNIKINGSYGTHNLVIGANDCKISLKEIDIINDNVNDIDSLLRFINEPTPKLNQFENKISGSTSILHPDNDFYTQYNNIKQNEIIEDKILLQRDKQRPQQIHEQIHEQRQNYIPIETPSQIYRDNNNSKNDYIIHNDEENIKNIEQTRPSLQMPLYMTRPNFHEFTSNQQSNNTKGKLIPKIYASGKYRRAYPSNI